MVKKILVIALFIMLFGCSSEFEALEDIDISEYNILHSNEDFTIWQQSEVPELEYSFCEMYETEHETTICIRYPGYNVWVVQIDNEFYNLHYGIEQSLYTTDDLMEYGVQFGSEIEE